MPKTTPPDPDGINNERAEWARFALDAFMQRTGTDPQDSISDLLCDLMHFCDRTRFEDDPDVPPTFAEELERAQRNYRGETLGE